MLQEAKKENELLKENLVRKQEQYEFNILLTINDSYIKREQEYRKTIDDIRVEIGKRSSDPFGFL